MLSQLKVAPTKLTQTRTSISILCLPVRYKYTLVDNNHVEKQMSIYEMILRYALNSFTSIESNESITHTPLLTIATLCTSPYCDLHDAYDRVS